MLDSVDPDAVRDAMANAATSLFVLASKSGSTIEPNVDGRRSAAPRSRRRRRRLGLALRRDHRRGHALHTSARSAERFRDIFVNPSDIGGRYSALSFFGMVPAALMGIDLDALLAGARAWPTACRVADPRSESRASRSARSWPPRAQAGRDKLTLLVPERARVVRPLGRAARRRKHRQAGQGRRADRRRAAGCAVRRAIAPPSPCSLAARRPRGVERARSRGRAAHRLDDARRAGARRRVLPLGSGDRRGGLLLGINPFDEPNVQQAKDATRALLDDLRGAAAGCRCPSRTRRSTASRLTLSAAGAGRARRAPTRAPFLRRRAAGRLRRPARLPAAGRRRRSPRAFADARAAIGRAHGVRDDVRLRPALPALDRAAAQGRPEQRRLHHRHRRTSSEDLPIPGEPFSFGVLEMAQALGDFQSLDRTGRRALHVAPAATSTTPKLLERLFEISLVRSDL